jgi:hypothetical protein
MNQIIQLESLRTSVPSLFATAPAASLSSRYAHVTTAEVVECLTKDGWQIASARQSGSRVLENREHVSHEVRLVLPEINATPGIRRVGDHVPQIVLGNSSDGTAALKLFAGLFRFVCLNGMVVGDATVAGISAVHRGASLQQQAIEAASNLRNEFSKVLGVVESWRSVRLDEPRTKEFAHRAAELRWPEINDPSSGLTVRTDDLLRRRRYDDNSSDFWTTFNRVQENLLRGGPRVTRKDEGEVFGRMQHARRVSSLSVDRSLNQNLWNLATEFAGGAS